MPPEQPEAAPRPFTPMRALSKITLEDFLNLLADEVIAKLGPRLTAKMQSPDELITQKNAPCDRRMFLEAARSGAFKSWRHGKSIFAYRSEVEEWIKAGKTLEHDPRLKVSDAASEEDLAAENAVRRAIGLKPQRMALAARARRPATPVASAAGHDAEGRGQARRVVATDEPKGAV